MFFLKMAVQLLMQRSPLYNFILRCYSIHNFYNILNLKTKKQTRISPYHSTRKKTTQTKDRKFVVIKIAFDYVFTEVKCRIIVNFMYPTAFHSFQYPQCYSNVRNLRKNSHPKLKTKSSPAFNIPTWVKINVISHQWGGGRRGGNYY